jgi:hypothetical protein
MVGRGAEPFEGLPSPGASAEETTLRGHDERQGRCVIEASEAYRIDRAGADYRREVASHLVTGRGNRTPSPGRNVRKVNGAAKRCRHAAARAAGSTRAQRGVRFPSGGGRYRHSRGGGYRCGGTSARTRRTRPRLAAPASQYQHHRKAAAQDSFAPGPVVASTGVRQDGLRSASAPVAAAHRPVTPGSPGNHANEYAPGIGWHQLRWQQGWQQPRGRCDRFLIRVSAGRPR